MRVRPGWWSAVVVTLALAGATGCSHDADARPPATASRPPATTSPTPSLPAPSAAALLTCSDEAREDITLALGVPTVAAPTSSWVAPQLTCVYPYPDGTLTLTVAQLPDEPATTAYFEARKRDLGYRGDLHLAAPAAFATTDGSAVVRKDFLVLLVAVAGLPPRFGQPPNDRDRVALIVANVILACWKEN
jgi:hypothetical protein